MMTWIHSAKLAGRAGPTLALMFCGLLPAQGPLPRGAEVTAHVVPAPETHSTEQRAAIFWLEPLSPDLVQQLAWKQTAPYRLLQKNKMFSPHFLVVPVGATVVFPNGDPFFHNVFSLFDGKRFDLGLYEAGRSRDVRFERVGISYIFCNIHPAMGAVVIALDTRLWTSDAVGGKLRIAGVPDGQYEAHLWLEGQDEQTLALWTHRITVTEGNAADAGSFQAKPAAPAGHLDKFGHPYKSDPSDY